jgi:hypothetical protein
MESFELGRNLLITNRGVNNSQGLKLNRVSGKSSGRGCTGLKLGFIREYGHRDSICHWILHNVYCQLCMGVQTKRVTEDLRIQVQMLKSKG